ncbi:MAG: biotin-dependent carboxyltransferase [Betaproteobacteria bacterium]|nr:MAG: biotin-dependent carboxyltransferase [Betaproteobacteria bacterium]
MSVRVLRPGMLTTVQDRGRHRMQHLGIVPGGAMDPVAFELANALVGNLQGEAALEFTLLGPQLAFEAAALIALCGAEFEATLDGQPMPLDRPVLVTSGTRLAAGRARRGSRAYLAVAGGIAVEPVLGSRSTYLPAQFGGWQGRVLRSDDLLPLAPECAALSGARAERLRLPGGAPHRTVPWSAPSLTLPEREFIVIHAMEGRHFGGFDADSQRAFFDATWRVAPASDRMGFRLLGPALARVDGDELLSEPTCLGTVQVPADGAPIALMADHQTTGGYPKIAEIAGADVPRLAQLAPGAALRFVRCTLAEAQALRRAARQRVESARRGIAWKYQS